MFQSAGTSLVILTGPAGAMWPFHIWPRRMLKLFGLPRSAPAVIRSL